MQDSDTTKYIIHANINADGIIERPDVVGAIFGQTEGLLGNDLDLRYLQKTGRVGRIDVDITSRVGKTSGSIRIPTSLDRIETAILAASLETIDQVGPCAANIKLTKIEDVRASKRRQIIDRAKNILADMFNDNFEMQEITDEVKQAVRIEEITYYGKDKLPAGPNILDSDAILLVEGRADVLNLLRYGIKNAIAVGGTNIPNEIIELSRSKLVTAFTDGDRGGELIIKELLQVADIDFIARAPNSKSVEDLTQKEIIKALRQKVPVEQVIDLYCSHDRRHDIRKKRIRRENLRKTKQELEIDDDFKKHIKELDGTLNARLLDANKNLLKEIAVRDLANVLRELNGGVKKVVFDGVITQRILDIASDQGIDCIVGVERGNITKCPTDIKILTINDLL
ncbi:MAG TPA: DNA primase [Methanosarcinales archaeon]|nr:DNA primase [Methanosarcinales archaeon]